MSGINQNTRLERLMKLGLLTSAAALSAPTAPLFSCQGDVCQYRNPSISLPAVVCAREGDCFGDGIRANKVSFDSMRQMAQRLPDWRVDNSGRYEGVSGLFKGDENSYSFVLGTERSPLSFLGLQGSSVLLETGTPEQMKSLVQALQRVKVANNGVCHPNIQCLLDFFVVPDDQGRFRPVVVTRNVAATTTAFDVLRNWQMTGKEKAEIVLKIYQAYQFLQLAGLNVIVDVDDNNVNNIVWNAETNEPVFVNVRAEGRPGGDTQILQYIRNALRGKLNRSDSYEGLLENLFFADTPSGSRVVNQITKWLSEM